MMTWRPEFLLSGFQRQIPDANTHITIPDFPGISGLVGPEYHQTLKSNEKVDIYSLGCYYLLGVLLMGNYTLPSDEFFQRTQELHMVRWMRKVMTSDDPRKALIDQSLLGNGYEEQMLLVLKIACFCTHDDPKERPTSKDCRIMLS